MTAFFEFIPLIIFFVVYKMVDIYWATGALIVAAALQMIVMKIQGKEIPQKQWWLFGLIAVFGALTLIFQNDAFIKWKVTIVNVFFAVGLWVSQAFFKKNLLQTMLGESIRMPEKIWTRYNYAWVAFFLVCGLLNLYVAFNFGQETWVNFKVFGLTIMTFVFALGSLLLIYKHIEPEPEQPQTDVSKSISNNEESGQ
ncbi:septation protein A [Thalassotalea mangrovi]|uniref:Inner membrane-spanning protein YciB n=1 Tax=Thalassotalea mangrovi TaxID=2572245 RepID=A0A4U1B750_9GAMM|nr:septation protein A [Thalassotalea mangrovi]TKB45755.1 septation protein A [Thalassotalea mangrovi]